MMSTIDREKPESHKAAWAHPRAGAHKGRPLPDGARDKEPKRDLTGPPSAPLPVVPGAPACGCRLEAIFIERGAP